MSKGIKKACIFPNYIARVATRRGWKRIKCKDCKGFCFNVGIGFGLSVKPQLFWGKGQPCRDSMSPPWPGSGIWSRASSPLQYLDSNSWTKWMFWMLQCFGPKLLGVQLSGFSASSAWWPSSVPKLFSSVLHLPPLTWLTRVSKSCKTCVKT